MPTLILSPRHTANSQSLWKAAITEGWDVERLASFHVPVEWETNPPQDPVLYGEPLFNQAVAESLGVEIAAPPDDFLIQIGEEFSGRWVQMLTVREARRIDKPTFFKPPRHKTFTAGIYESGSFLPDFLELDEMVLCQDVVRFHDEFRFFVLDGQVVTGSCYINSGQFVGDSDGEHNPYHRRLALALVDRMLDHASNMLPRSVVIDAGILRDESGTPRAAIVEANEANASGLYQCDPAKALRAIRHATVPLLKDQRDNLSEYDMDPERQCVGKVLTGMEGGLLSFADGSRVRIKRTEGINPGYSWEYIDNPSMYILPKPGRPRTER